MKLSATCIFQGFETRSGIKDPTKIYNEVALLDGMDQLRCTVDPALVEKVLPGIAQYSRCNCTFELNTRFNSLRLVGIAPVK